MFENAKFMTFRGQAGGVERQRGFTLIEMSIVLVIIGLIIGGIIKGQEVVNGARLKSQLAQMDAIKGAVFTFQDKFGYLPGDYKGASTLTLTSVTTDGNQNGFVAGSSTSSTSLADNSDVSGSGTEAPTAWLQLSATNLLAGINTGGVALASATTATYAGRAGNSFLWFATFNTGYGITANAVRLQGGQGQPAPILREQDAFSMDSKFDDGVPGTGSIIVTNTSSTTGCTAAAPASGSAGSYSLGAANPASLTCALDFIVE